MKLVVPSECQIGAHTFKIIFNDKSLRIANIRAQINYTEEVIRLSTHGTAETTDTCQRSPTEMLVELMHEIVHGIDNYFCGGEITEQQAEALAEGLTQVLLSLGIEPDFSQIPEEEL